MTRVRGFAPLWSRNSRELFYASPQRELIAVTVGPGTAPQLGERRVLFTLSEEFIGGAALYYTPYDISADGSRFIMVRRTKASGLATKLVVIENFTEELKRRH